MLTFEELLEKLKREDVLTILEALEIESEELVDAFHDKIEERFEQLVADFDDTQTPEE